MAVAQIMEATFKSLVYGNLEMTSGTADLTDATKLEIITGLSDTKVCWHAEQVEAAGVAATKVIILPKAADTTKIEATAVGATGTTTIMWFAIGIPTS